MEYPRTGSGCPRSEMEYPRTGSGCPRSEKDCLSHNGGNCHGYELGGDNATM